MDYFTLAVALLCVLAAIDLSVGVSNDAVNFLNSAVGSQAAGRRVLMLVVCAGVICGAVFSSGIMQVARSGIINPELFSFADIMVVFLAVMIADVLLLDLYNTFGLPTSTTVSLVFGLLGAATATAIIHVTHTPDAPSFIKFLNGRQALTILTGIGASVGIAFVAGMVVQFFSRLLFTFDEGAASATLRTVWSAVALTLIADFLFLKGLKGASFITPEITEFVAMNTGVLLAGLFAFWLVVSWLIHRMGGNPLRFTVLAGTFALAMAFASNDLVNFIGVPMAGFESWKLWLASGQDAEAFLMHDLARPVTGNSVILLAAGGIMAMTLWLSGKAQTVIQTEVTLGRQDEGAERFRPGPISRGLVRMFGAAGKQLHGLAPEWARDGIERRFQRKAVAIPAPNGPAFDLIRASVNLTVASTLIAFATTLKLPLSTTFVTFMVAMGASLSDRAWGRDTAAYRVAGVLSVISGWFITAAGAFLLAAVFAVILSTFEGYGLAFLAVLLVATMAHTFRLHGTRVISDLRALARAAHAARFDHQVHLLQSQLSTLLQECSDCIDLAIRGLLEGRRPLLDEANRRISELRQSCASKEVNFVRILKHAKPDIDSELLKHLRLLSCQQDLFHSVQTIVAAAGRHVLDSHGRLTDESGALLSKFNDSQRQIVALQANAWGSVEDQEKIAMHLEDARDLLTHSIRAAVNDLYGNVRPVNFTTLLLTLLTELESFALTLGRARLLWTAPEGPPQQGTQTSDQGLA